MKICHFCRIRILESGSAWGTHQDSFEDYKSSAQEACVFCTRVASVLSATRWHSHIIRRALMQPGRPIYRWTIRKAAKIREMPDSFIIAFREIPACDGHELESLMELPDLTFHMLHEKDVPGAPTASSMIGDRTSSAEAMQQVTKWVTTCDQSHTGKCRLRRGPPPTRLIDVGDASGQPNWPPHASDRFMLVETDGKTIDRYVTLSHCWGSKPFARLLKENIADYEKEGIPWSEICRNTNFRDALEVARGLKVRYIWIDSLCIIQNSEGGKDWEHEAPLMHMVYKNSYCNIAASDSPDSDGGLYRLRAVEDIVPARYPVEGDIPTGNLKERMLAPRAIHFTSNQIFWNCPTHSACESLPDGLPRPLDHLASMDRAWLAQLQQEPAPLTPSKATLDGELTNIPYEFWRIAVHKYTSCALTYHSDKLKALWGIAQIVCKARDEKFVAGLWDVDLVEQLAWAVVNPEKSLRPPYTPKQGEKLLDWFPSWSWASVTGEVEVVDKRRHSICYKATGHKGGALVAPVGKATVDHGMPEIRKEKAVVRLRCYRGKGELVRNDKATSWVLNIPDTAHSRVSVPAFPDVSPSGNNLLGPLDFLVLAVTERSVPLDENVSILYGEESRDNERQLYSGIGLMVKTSKDWPDKGNAHAMCHVERVGMIRFTDITREHWELICRVCGQDDDVLVSGQGEILFLV